MRFWILVAIVTCTLFAAARSEELSAESRETFEWFSTLGYPDVKEARWVEVSEKMEDPSSSYKWMKRGFVLSETETEIRILCEDLTEEHLIKGASNHFGYGPLTVEEKPFLATVKNTLFLAPRNLLTPHELDSDELDAKARVFFLAYVCWQRNEMEFARKLFDKAAAIYPAWHAKGAAAPVVVRLQDQAPNATPPPERPPGEFREELERELGAAAFKDAILQFAGTRMKTPYRAFSVHFPSREELVENVRRIQARFPKSRFRPQLDDLLARTEKMIEEEAGHKTVTPQELARLPVEKQVEELIFQLRNQHGGKPPKRT